MTTPQGQVPEALRLAAELEAGNPLLPPELQHARGLRVNAATTLRELAAQIAALTQPAQVSAVESNTAGAALPSGDTVFLSGKAAGRQEVKDEQQTPDFATWIRQAYREPESTSFTIHNMEVAYQAGVASHGQAPAGAAVEMHEARCPALIGDACSCERSDPAVDKAWAQFCAGIGDGPTAPYPGMIGAFERYYGQSFADKDWRDEAAVWAAAWKARDAQPTPTAQAAPAGDLPEEQTQPWYDLAWRHGARRHTSFDGDELTELSFSPTQFDAFCADLAPAAGAVAGPTEADTVDLVGVRANGEHVNLGKIAMPPRMKAREIAVSQFGGFQDDDGSDAEMCFVAMEELLAWMPKQGWAATPAVIPAVAPTPAAPADSGVQEDAARYRWLRAHWFTMESNYQRCITFKVGVPRWSDIPEEQLDSAIDAARATGASDGS